MFLSLDFAGVEAVGRSCPLGLRYICGALYTSQRKVTATQLGQSTVLLSHNISPLVARTDNVTVQRNGTHTSTNFSGVGPDYSRAPPPAAPRPPPPPRPAAAGRRPAPTTPRCECAGYEIMPRRCRQVTQSGYIIDMIHCDLIHWSMK